MLNYGETDAKEPNANVYLAKPGLVIVPQKVPWTLRETHLQSAHIRCQLMSRPGMPIEYMKPRSFSFSPPDRKGLLDFMIESAFAMLLHHAPAQYPARAARQWIPPSIPPDQLAFGSRRVSRQSSSPVDPAQYPARAARQWIPPNIPPVDPAQHPARAARQWIPPSIPPEQLASGSRRVSRQSSWPVDPAEYPTNAARLWIPPSIPPIPPSVPPEQPASGSRRVSR